MKLVLQKMYLIYIIKIIKYECIIGVIVNIITTMINLTWYKATILKVTYQTCKLVYATSMLTIAL